MATKLDPEKIVWREATAQINDGGPQIPIVGLGPGNFISLKFKGKRRAPLRVSIAELHAFMTKQAVKDNGSGENGANGK